MALNGTLDEIALLDILQIVAFSQKTGNLYVNGAFGEGGVAFKNGLIHYAFSPTTIDVLRSFRGAMRSEKSEAMLLEQIQIALRELVGLQDGSFEFELTDEPPQATHGLDAQSLYLEKGVDTQRILLSLAKEIDDERRETTELLESSFDEAPELDAGPADVSSVLEPLRETELGGGEEKPSVVLVDDEEMVTSTLADELVARGYVVLTASGPAEGLSATRSLVATGKNVLLATDLRMPTTTGRSFSGGFELVRSLRREGMRVPVLLMTEKWGPKVRARAKKLGIRQVAFKPALSKLDPTQYGADLRSFAASLAARLDTFAKDEVHTRLRAQPEGNAHLLDYLASMTERLMNPAQKGEISKMVLLVASRYLERGVLFLVKKEIARGLSGFGLAEGQKANSELAQKISIDINDVGPFAEVVHSRRTHRFPYLDALEPSPFAALGRGGARECILIPLLNNREVLAILYGDNHVTGKPLGKLRGLELFIAQAGMAIENLSLHRKLSLFQSRLFSGQERTTQR